MLKFAGMALLAMTAALPALAHPTAESFTSPTPAGLGAGAVRSGMDYSAFRHALLGVGWQAPRNPECVTGVYGGDGTRAPHETNICRELPEIEACSGDGYCVMNFRDASGRHAIRVTTYGDYTAWAQPGLLSVLGWEQQ